MGRKNGDGIFMVARREFEYELIEIEVERCKGNKLEASRRLGISYATLKSIRKDGLKKSATLTEADKKLISVLRESVLKRIAGECADVGAALATYVETVRGEMIGDIRKKIAASF